MIDKWMGLVRTMDEKRRQQLVKLAEAAQVCADIVEEKDALMDWAPWADLGNTILKRAEELKAESE